MALKVLNLDSGEEHGEGHTLIVEGGDVKGGDTLRAKDGATFKVEKILGKRGEQTACRVSFGDGGERPSRGDELLVS